MGCYVVSYDIVNKNNGELIESMLSELGNKAHRLMGNIWFVEYESLAGLKKHLEQKINKGDRLMIAGCHPSRVKMVNSNKETDLWMKKALENIQSNCADKK